MITLSESPPELVLADADWADAMRRAEAHSPFLASIIKRRPQLAETLQAGDWNSAWGQVREAGADANDLGTRLRRERLALALALGIADLAGAVSLEELTAQLSLFADRALDAAIKDAILRRAPDADPKGFVAIALGKHGGEELNYSSDIDPIFLYDPDTLPRRPRDEPGEAAQRVARQVCETLNAPTAEGYVFRVDLRLRPASEVSPPAISIDTAISHYESSALAWEQAAFIRSRAASGDLALGQSFLAAIRPFVWRRSLDFGMIAAIGGLTLQIRDHYSAGQRLGPGFDLKRGRGGIREVEFFAQTHQLIHGGRNPDLRTRKTRHALQALADAGIVPHDEANMLAAHYETLRTLEHRLQMVSDHQTHSLPNDAAAMDNVARLHGLADAAALAAHLQPVVANVGQVYDRLIDQYQGRASNGQSPDQEAGLSTDLRKLGEQMQAMGFADGESVAARIEKWRGGEVRAIRSEAARGAFENVLPMLMPALARAPDPARALNRWDDLIRSLPSAVNIFRLLEARPALLTLVADILSHAPVLADALARNGQLLDRLIDASALDPVGDVADLAARFARQEAGDDYERLLDSVRRQVNETRFALGVQLIEGAADPLDVAAGYGRTAEAALRTLADAAVREFVAVHGVIPDSELLILALGRMGGGVLTHASDLDLVFLFSGSFDRESDGRKPLGATLYYNRLAQRVIAAMSVPTAAGALYEVDVRLRPSGAQGPLVVSIDSFLAYQAEDAWTWEHMAMCRARMVYGSAEPCARLMDGLHRILADKARNAAILADALKMRGDMARHKPPSGPLDVKLLPGGLVDMEFIIHTLQLTHRITPRPDLADAIADLQAAGLVGADFATSYRLMARLLVVLRLVSPDSSLPDDASRPLVAEAVKARDWDDMLAQLDAARHGVMQQWQASFGQPRDALNANTGDDA